MTHPNIPTEVLALLHERLAGLDEIKALLLVRGDPSRTWTPAAVATVLLRPEGWSTSALESLSEAGLLLAAGDGPERRFSYRPTTPELDTAVAALVDIYGDDGLDVIRLLNSAAFDRIRSAVWTLGDAIALGKSRTKPPPDDERGSW